MNNSIVRAEQLKKSYHDGTTSIDVLNGIDFSIKAGDRVAIVGPSGSGKSTLLHLLGGLDKPTSGKVFLNERNWQELREHQRCTLRNQSLGFVYQFHHLLPEFTALENVAMPLLLAKCSVKDAIARALVLLDQVGLSSRATHKPAQLSGGERQRVAIARALIHQPKCVFADEPTGNLDYATAVKIFELMLALNEKFKTALVIVTHDQHMASRMNVVMSLQKGILSIDQ